jgi:hypothetical protein
MDAIDLLKGQHQEVSELMLRVDGSQGEERKEHFLRLARALTVHAQLEEEQFYVALRRAETADFLHHSEEEHGHVRGLLSQMTHLHPDSLPFRALLVELREWVDAHVAEEQAELFPKAYRLLGVEGLTALGEALLERMWELEAPHGLQTFSQRADALM